MRLFGIKKINIIVLSITLVIATIFFFLIFPKVHPYKFKPIFLRFLDSTYNYLYRAYYFDLDNDGSLERISYNHNPIQNFSFIVVETNKNEYIDQFNFNGKFPHYYKPFISDVNKDKIFDIIMFDIFNDSLFINAIDVFNKKFIFQKVFLIEKPDSVNRKYWDLDIQNGVFLDINEDGNEDFIFSVIAGYSRYPRTIIAFDLTNQKVIKKINFGLYVDDLIIQDINNDKKPEILVSNSARDNYKEYIQYHDKKAWHFIMDKNFKVVSPKDTFGGFTSALHYGTDQNNTYAFFIWNNYKVDSIDVIYKIKSDFSLQPVKKVKLCFRPLILSDKNSKKWLIINSQNNSIQLLDSNFNLIREYNLNYKRDILLSVIKDINNDEAEDIVVFFGNKLSLMDQNFNTLAELELDNKSDMFDPNYFQFEKISNKVYGLFRTNYYQLDFELVTNPIKAYFNYIFIAGTFSLYVLLFQLIKLFIFFMIYLNFFIHSFRKSNLGLILLDSEGKVIYTNSQIGNFFNIDEKYLKNKFLTSVFSEQQEIKDCIFKGIKTGLVQTDSFSYSTPTYQISGKVIITPYKILFNKLIIGFLVEIENLTEAIMKDRIKVWAKYVQKIAHDIKTPLSAVNFGIENIKNQLNKSGQLDRDLNEDFDRILRQTKKILNSTRNILQLSNLELTNYQVTYIDKVLDDSLEKFQNKLKANSIKLIKEYNLNGEVTWADPAQLIQAFQIIIENAIDAISTNGFIKISAFANEQRKSIVVEISDNGCGIKSELKNKIFTPYLTTKHDGTGIGLYVVKMIIDAHNGNIYFESEENKGTIFTIELPILQKKEVLTNE